MDSKEKDRLWKQYNKAKEWAKDNCCTKKELNNPTERNVQKCMRDIQASRHTTETMKAIGKVLGEETNFEKFRRSK